MREAIEQIITTPSVKMNFRLCVFGSVEHYVIWGSRCIENLGCKENVKNKKCKYI